MLVQIPRLPWLCCAPCLYVHVLLGDECQEHSLLNICEPSEVSAISNLNRLARPNNILVVPQSKLGSSESFKHSVAALQNWHSFKREVPCHVNLWSLQALWGFLALLADCWLWPDDFQHQNLNCWTSCALPAAWPMICSSRARCTFKGIKPQLGQGQHAESRILRLRCSWRLRTGALWVWIGCPTEKYSQRVAVGADKFRAPLEELKVRNWLQQLFVANSKRHFFLSNDPVCRMNFSNLQAIHGNPVNLTLKSQQISLLWGPFLNVLSSQSLSHSPQC